MNKKWTWLITLMVIASLVFPSAVYAAAGDISGSVSGVAGAAEVVLTAVSEGHATCQTSINGSGAFTLAGCEQGFVYTVTPSANGYTFTPASRQVTTGADTVSAGAFAAAIQKFTVSGTITAGDPPVGLAGVTVKLGSFTDKTDASGAYSLMNVPYGRTGDITPTRPGYTFDPVSLSVNVTGDLNGQNFTATEARYAISGRITVNDASGAGLAGVTVRLGAFSTTTGADGTYSLANLPYGARGSLVAFLPGWRFMPSRIAVATLKSDLTDKNFVAQIIGFSIRGRVTYNGRGVRGVQMTATAIGETPQVVTTSASGSYLLKNLVPGKTYFVTPKLAGFTFDPATATISNIGANMTQNFRADLIRKTISGTISGLNGTDTAQVFYGPGKNMFVTTTPGTGAYTIPNLPANVAYRLVPAAPRYRFTPTEIVVPAGEGDAANQNFTAVEQVIVSGQVVINGRAVRGVTITASANGQNYNTITDGKGMYSILVPRGTQVTFSAAHAYFTFAAPAPLTPDADTTLDWTSATVIVTGRVVETTGQGMANVTMAAGTATAVTNASGNYSLTVTETDVPNPLSFKVAPQPVDGFKFKPTTRPVTLGSGKANKNFVGIRQGYSISGQVTLNGAGLGGVRVSAGSRFAFSNSAGNYTIKNVPFGLSVNLTAYRFGFSFDGPDPFTMPTSNVTGMDFAATALPRNRTISGSITGGPTNAPMSGVVVRLTYKGFPLGATSTRADGRYTFTNLVPDNGFTIQPFKTNYIFIPTGAVIVSTVTSDATINFRAMRVAVVTGVISGAPAGTQAVFTINGNSGSTVQRTVTLGRGGRYSLPELVEDSYTMSVQITGYTITPASTTFTIDSSSPPKIVRNFAAQTAP